MGTGYDPGMDFKAYGRTVVLGARSMLSAAAGWRSNPLTADTNRKLWGRPWVLVLALAAVATIVIELLLPPVERLAELVPPFSVLGFLPDLVLDLLYSGPAWFAVAACLRLRALRSSASSAWPEGDRVADFGGLLFDAAALPIVISASAIGLALELAPVVGRFLNAGADNGATDAAMLIEASGSGRFARTVLVAALVVGIGSVHRRLAGAFGKLIAAAFMVWGMHLGIAFAVPWMTAWWGYLPGIGHLAPHRSVAWAHTLFDLAVAFAAWLVVREKWRSSPLWSEQQITHE